MTQLLVSVRSATEAEAALRGGAALIDVKEPTHGPLGRASDDVIAEVVSTVAGQRPVSVAMGELVEAVVLSDLRRHSAQYVKWGLAGSQSDWSRLLRNAMRRMTKHQPSCRAVAVAYADWQRADAPRPEEICSFAVEHRAGAFLIDTFEKDGSTLLDWLSLRAIQRLREHCRCAGVPVALAGSLGPVEIRRLLPLQPEWFAVRGAVCHGRRRASAVEENKVRELAGLIRAISPNPNEPEALATDI